MNAKLVFFTPCFLLLCATTPALAELRFTIHDVEIAKSACLVGSAYKAGLNADGSISVKNFEAKGEFVANKKEINVQAVPDEVKKAEFDTIRVCIRAHLIPESMTALTPL
jgi:hypothetical protein